MNFNGSSTGHIKIEHQDMGGWVRVHLLTGKSPDDLPVFLSHALTEWFRHHPHLRLTHVVPIQVDGNTQELHAWYEQINFPDVSPLAKR